MSRLRVRTLSTPRAGSTAAENEDAVVLAADALPARLAVADGATETAFAGSWARTLAAALVRPDATRDDGWERAVEAARQAHAAHVARALPGLPWYAAAKAEQGSAATALALRIDAGGAWAARAVGDVCLLVVRAGALRLAWPIDDPAAFSDTPALVSSRPGRAATAVCVDGTWQPGDAFVVATDAVAAWLMRADAARALHWDDEAFAGAVARARADGTLRNDDATLVCIETMA